MASVLRIVRVLVVVVQDVVLGSGQLAKRLTTSSARLYRQAQRLTSGSPTTPADAKGEKDEEQPTAPSSAGGTPQASPSTAKSAAETKPEAAKAGARKKPTARKTWTLDRCAAAAGLGWTAWCFTHRPLAAGWHALVPDLQSLAPWAAAWWVVAAWLTAQYEKNKASAAPAADEQSGPAPGPDPEDVRAAGLWLLNLVCTRVAAAAEKGRKGVHLNMLLDEPGIPTSWTVQTLREHCERLGIPVKSMRIRGAGTGPTHGVHVDELTAALGRPLADVLRALKELRTDAAPDTPSGTPAEGAEEVPVTAVVDAPADPAPGPRGTVTFEEALARYLTGSTDPTRTPGHSPLPAAAPASHGRG